MATLPKGVIPSDNTRKRCLPACIGQRCGKGTRSRKRAFVPRCGLWPGLDLVIAAACHPHSEFVGIDFMPEHIAHARSLAQDCGLTNVSILEGDFLALSESPDTLGEFDFAVCHGIATWVAPVIRQALFKLVGRVLKPGGLFYNRYNTLPGWLPMLPFQQLVLLQQRTQS